MKNILILGALPNTQERRELYESIIDVCKSFVDVVSSPIDTLNFKGTEKERYNHAFRKVVETDLVIGEQSEPSTGQGMEIRECAVLNKPLIVIAKEGRKVSGLVKGCPVLREIIYYENLEDLKSQLIRALKSLK